jgi:hypothetical protein
MTTKNILLIGFLAFVTALGWRISERLSADAIGILLGVVFGALAIFPTMLILLNVNRQQGAPPVYPQLSQPPIIIVSGQPERQVIESERLPQPQRYPVAARWPHGD